MGLVLSKLEKDAFTVFTSFQNKYLKANSRKSNLIRRSDNVLHINVEGDQLSSRKYDKLLRMLIIDHKWTFEDHLLDIVQKINQQTHVQTRISKYAPQKKLRSTMKALV